MSIKIVGLGDLEISEFPRIRESKDSKTQTGGYVRSSGPWIQGFDFDPGIRGTSTEFECPTRVSKDPATLEKPL